MKLFFRQTEALQQRHNLVVAVLGNLIALVLFSTACGGGGTTAGPLAGNAPAVNLAPASVSFSSQVIDKSSAVQSVSLANNGSADLNITSLAMTGADANSFVQTNNCGSVLGAGAKCTIKLTFTPSASGSHEASLTITDNAAGSPHLVSLSGTATTAEAAASLSPLTLNFGNQSIGTPSAAQTLTLTNSGNATLTITGVAVAGADARDFAAASNCGASVAAGANCEVSVTFTPAASGSRAATLTIADNASSGSQAVSLSGAGTNAAAATLSLSSANLAFGSQPIEMTSSAQTVTLTNTGTAALSVTALGVTGVNAGDYEETGTCGNSIAAGANCTIAVMFTPGGGARTAALSIADNATGSPQTVSLSGTGSHDVILSWTASPTAGVIGYNVYRGTTRGGEGVTPVNSTPTNGTTYTDQNVTAGATYYYVVAAIASSGSESAASNEAAAIIP